MNPASDSPPGAMPARDLIAALDRPHTSPPSTLLRDASNRWHALREPLLARVHQEIHEVRNGLRSEYSDAAIFTLYLAAEQRSAEAFPTLLALLSLRDPLTLERFGDVFLDDMPVILADCYPGENALPALESIISQPALPLACRCAVLHALEILAWQQRVSPASLRPLLERLADGALETAQPSLWTAFAEVTLAAGLSSLEPLVLEAFRRGWIDPRTIPPQVLSTAFAQVREGTYQPFTSPVTIKCAATEIESWNWNSLSGQSAQSAQSALAVTAPARPGRNDLCPCGSGKKFKRCCVRTGLTSGLSSPPP